jgi:osmotically inducible protein OsmC
MPTTLTDIAYSTSAAAKGGRGGHVRSADGVVDLDLGKPGSVTNPKANPETLFAAGYAACFQGALTARAGQQDIDASDSSVTATVSLGSASDGGFGLAVAIEASIPGLGVAQTQELMELAHEVCPYSKATRGNIVVTLTAV